MDGAVLISDWQTSVTLSGGVLGPGDWRDSPQARHIAGSATRYWCSWERWKEKNETGSWILGLRYKGERNSSREMQEKVGCSTSKTRHLGKSSLLDSMWGDGRYVVICVPLLFYRALTNNMPTIYHWHRLSAAGSVPNWVEDKNGRWECWMPDLNHSLHKQQAKTVYVHRFRTN